MSLRVVACVTCKEYIIVKPSDPINQERLSCFIDKHSSNGRDKETKKHLRITAPISEVEGYKMIKSSS